jgi:hypothetical protein
LRKLPAPFDDLVFLPANLTRLVIDPYRERCNTRTVIGGGAQSPLELSGPVLIGGIPFSELADGVVAALCRGAKAAEVGLRVPIGVQLPSDDLRVVRVVPLQGRPDWTGAASAVELAPDDPSGPLRAGDLRQAAERCRSVAPQIPIGVALAPGRVASNVQAAVEAGMDFVTLCAMRPSDAKGPGGPVEAEGVPQIEVLAEAIEGLRAVNREGDLDLIYFGGIRGGGDAAKALAMGATAVMIEQAALIAVGACQGESDAGQGAERVVRFVRALLMEASILARGCGKTDLHNLEPEDLRSLTIETSRLTGVPLVGRDVVFRNRER